MRNLSLKNLSMHKGDDFETVAWTVLARLDRTALILTKTPSDAEQLIRETYSHAKQKYHQLEPDTSPAISARPPPDRPASTGRAYAPSGDQRGKARLS